MAERAVELQRLDIDGALHVAANGGSLHDILKALGCTARQFQWYCRKYPSFAQEVKEAREMGFQLRAESLPETITSGLFTDSKVLRVYVDTEKWLLSKMHSQVFGDKQTITVEHVDLTAALKEAKSRVIDVSPKPQAVENCVNPFE